jgi:adenylate kinase family enzyme
VTGASGSGTTTLARAVADAWSVPHADANDYFWMPTDPPYVDKRREADRVALMAQVFLPQARARAAGERSGG